MATLDRWILHGRGWLGSLRDMEPGDLTRFEKNLMEDLEDLLNTSEEICEWCGEPVNNGKTHGQGRCFAFDDDPCPECRMIGQHKLQCSHREDGGQLRLPAKKVSP